MKDYGKCFGNNIGSSNYTNYCHFYGVPDSKSRNTSSGHRGYVAWPNRRARRENIVGKLDHAEHVALRYTRDSGTCTIVDPGSFSRALGALLRQRRAARSYLADYPAFSKCIRECTNFRFVRLTELFWNQQVGYVLEDPSMVKNGDCFSSAFGQEMPTGDSPGDEILDPGEADDYVEERRPRGRRARHSMTRQVYNHAEDKHEMDDSASGIWGWIYSALGATKDMVFGVMTASTKLWDWLSQLTVHMFGSFFGFMTRTVPSVIQQVTRQLEKLVDWGRKMMEKFVTPLIWNAIGMIFILMLGGILGLFSYSAVERFAETALAKAMGRWMDLSEYSDAAAGKAYKSWASRFATGDGPGEDEPLMGFVTLAVSVLAVGLYGGVTASGRNFMVQMKNVIVMNRLCTSIYGAMIGLFHLIPESTRYRVMEHAAPKMFAEYQNREWIARSSALLTLSKSASLIASPGFKDSLEKLLIEGNKLLKKGGNQTVGVHYALLVKTASTLFNYHNTATRTTPFSLHLYGAPGIGKSCLIKTLIKDAFNIDDGGIYMRPNSSPFWNGFVAQKAIVYDEFMAAKDKQNLAYTPTEYLDLVSCNDFQPPLASVDDVSVGIKGTYAYPDVVMTIANRGSWNDVGVDVDAFHRRRDLVIEVSLSNFGEKYYDSKSKNMMMSKLIKEDPDAFDDYAWLSFQCCDIKGGGNPQKKMSYFQLLDLIIDKKNDHDDVAQALAAENDDGKRSFEVEYEKAVRSLLGDLEPLLDNPMVKSELGFLECASGDGPGNTSELPSIVKPGRVREYDSLDARSIASDDDDAETVVGKPRVSREIERLVNEGPTTHETRAYTLYKVRNVFKNMQSYLEGKLEWIVAAGIFATLVCIIAGIWRFVKAPGGDFGPSVKEKLRHLPRRRLTVRPPDTTYGVGDGSGSSQLRGLVRLSWDGVHWQQALGTHDKYIVLNYHFFLQEVDLQPVLYPNGRRFLMIRGDKEYSIEFDTQNLTQWHEDDVALYFLNDNRVQSFKDIRSRFLRECDFDSTRRYYGIMHLKDRVQQLSMTYEDNVTYIAQGHSFNIPCMTYSGSFKSGDCGSPIVGSTMEMAGKILGFHVASYKNFSNTGFCTFVFREHLFFAQAPVLEKPSEIEIPMGDFNFSGPNVKSEGPSRAPRGCGGSSLRESVLRPHLLASGFPSSFAPAVVNEKDPRWMNHYGSRLFPTPLEMNVTRTTSVSLPDIHMDLDDIVDTMVDKYGINMHGCGAELSLEQASFGIPGLIEPISKDSSPGYPFTRLAGKLGKHAFLDWESGKLDPVFKDEMVEKIARAREGYPGEYVYSATLKDEIVSEVKAEECRSRIFYGCPLDLQLISRVVLGRVIVQLIKDGLAMKNSLAIGINQGSWDFDAIYRYLSEVNPPGFIAGDGKEFDRRVHPRVLDASYKVIIRLAEKAGCDPVLVKHVCDAGKSSVVLAGRRELEYKCSHLSGAWFTTIINCLNHEIMWRWAFQELCPGDVFDLCVRAKFLGDDNVVAVTPRLFPKFNAVTYAQQVALIGSLYTSDDKETPLTPAPRKFKDITFLGCHPIQFKGRWMGAYKKLIFFKALQFTRTRDATTEAEAHVWVELSSAWGEEFYLWYSSCVNKALRAEGLRAQEVGRAYDVRKSVAERGVLSLVGEVATGDSPPDFGLTSYSLSRFQPDSREMVQQRSTAIKATRADLEFGLESDVIRHTFKWTTSDKKLMKRHIVPGDLLLENPDNLQNMPFENFTYFRGNMKITFQVNGTPFQAGMLIAAHRPLRNGDMLMNDLTTLDHVKLNPYNSPNEVLTIPFRFDRQYMHTDWMFKHDKPKVTVLPFDYCGLLWLYVLSPLTMGDVNVTILTRFEDCEFVLPKAVAGVKGVVRLKEEGVYDWKGQAEVRGDGNINTTYQVERVLGNFDSRVQGHQVETDTNVGFDNPPMASGGVPVGLQLGGLSKSVGVYNTLGMELYPGVVRPVKKGVFGTDVDEMDMAWLMNKQILLSDFKWSADDFTGHLCQSGTLSPVVHTDGLDIVGAGVTRAIADHFTFWRSNIVLTFVAVKTPYHSGKLRLSVNYGSDGLVSYAASLRLYAGVVDFTGENSVGVVEIPYNASTEFLRTYSGPNVALPGIEHMGRWNVHVMNELVCPASVSSEIHVLVFLSFSSPVFSVPRSWGLSGFRDPGRTLVPRGEQSVFLGGALSASDRQVLKLFAGGDGVEDVARKAEDAEAVTPVQITASSSEEAPPISSDSWKWGKYCVRNLIDLFRRHSDITHAVEFSQGTLSKGLALRGYSSFAVWRNTPEWDLGDMYAGWYGSLKYRIRADGSFKVYYFPWGDVHDGTLTSAGAGLLNTVDVVNVFMERITTMSAIPNGLVSQEMPFAMGDGESYVDVTIPYQHQNEFLRTKNSNINNALDSSTGLVVVVWRGAERYAKGHLVANLTVMQGAGDDFRYGIYCAPNLCNVWPLCHGVMHSADYDIFGRRVAGGKFGGFKLSKTELDDRAARMPKSIEVENFDEEEDEDVTTTVPETTTLAQGEGPLSSVENEFEHLDLMNLDFYKLTLQPREIATGDFGPRGADRAMAASGGSEAAEEERAERAREAEVDRLCEVVSRLERRIDRLTTRTCTLERIREFERRVGSFSSTTDWIRMLDLSLFWETAQRVDDDMRELSREVARYS